MLELATMEFCMDIIHSIVTVMYLAVCHSRMFLLQCCHYQRKMSASRSGGICHFMTEGLNLVK